MIRRKNSSSSVDLNDIENINLDDFEDGSVKEEKEKEKENELAVIERLETNIDMNFSEEQKKVITHFGSPLNVIACAGAGKSTVIVNKMFYLELAKQIKVNEMLVITYNTEARKEIEERYLKLRKSLKIQNRKLPTFKTFHALFLMILKTLNKYKNVQVISGTEYNYDLMKLIVNDGVKDKKEVLSDILKYRGTVINKSISEDGIENVDFENVSFRPSIYKKVIAKYEQLKQLNNSIDFDDMMIILKHELQGKNKDKLVEDFRNTFSYILIDEFQDISKLQLDIIDMLVGDFNKYVVVGDDDQTINSFRGAETKYIKDFILRYPRAERLFLSSNYRCKSNILDTVKGSIKRNISRVDKEIKAFNSGGNVKAVPIKKDISDLADIIKEDLSKMEENNYSISDFAVLVRLNSQRMILADSLAEKGINVDIGNMNYSLRNNKVYKTIFMVIKAIKEKNDSAFSEVGHMIFKSVNKKLIADYSRNPNISWYKDFVSQPKYLVSNTIIDTINKIEQSNNARNCILYSFQLLKEHYVTLSEKGFYNMQQVLEIVKHLSVISKGLTVAKFYKSEKIKESYLEYHCNSFDGIKIKTLHTVKGLEFKNVYFVGIDADKLPNIYQLEHLISNGNVDEAVQYIEEERRLLYVGITRAIENLTISYSMDIPSPFLYELENIDLEGVSNIPEKEQEKDYSKKLLNTFKLNNSIE